MEAILKATAIYAGKVDFNKVKENLKKEWDIEVSSEAKESGFTFNVGNTLIHFTLNEEAGVKELMLDRVKSNQFWPEGSAALAKASTFVDISLENGKDRVKLAKIFVKAVDSVLRVPGAIAVDNGQVVAAAADYTDFSQIMKENEFPVLNMINFGMYKAENGIGGYSNGLKFFGKKEIEILDTDVDVEGLYTFMIDIADYVITSDVVLNDGETVGFTPEQRIPLTISEGVAVKGESIKIGLTKENI